MQVCVLSGGVGGSRFVWGLAQLLNPGELEIVVNTGDDFDYLGLRICPDLDTVMYVLAGINNQQQGWGIENESLQVVEGLAKIYNNESWFLLGDKDLGTHLLRRQWLNDGLSLSKVTKRLCEQLKVKVKIIPMSDKTVPTLIETANGKKHFFQEWFVKNQCKEAVNKVILHHGYDQNEKALRAINKADIVFIAPSNPYLSIDPILNGQGVKQALQEKLVIAVSPIIGAKAVKGPLVSMIKQITGGDASAKAIAEHYRGIINGMVVEKGDAFSSSISICETEILMINRDIKRRLAQQSLELASSLLG
jgi:LPPG:FO 2-phospho-L-lactate transferase